MNLREERLRRIMDYLKEKGFAKISEISKFLGVSEITVRRDLKFLESQGLVKRSRGGALLKNFQVEYPFFFRLEEATEEKKRIGKKAVELLENGQIVAMSGGSTVFYAAKALDYSPIHDLTILTNSITTAWAIINLKKHFKLIHSGGTVRENSFECVGGSTLNFYREVNVDVFLLGVDGIDPEWGVTFYDYEEAIIAKEIVKNSEKVMVLADKRKIGRKAPFKVCEIEEVDFLVTDWLSDEARKAFEEKGVKVLIA